MNPNDPNVVLLERVAERLGGGLRQQLVFVGGAAAGLLITDTAMPAIRPTEDIDLIVETLALADYRRIEAALAARGFSHDLSAEAPICRWRVDAIVVDVMPTLERILGFSNRWYPAALRTAIETRLPSGIVIRLIAAPAFLATKLEAFVGRGKNDYLFSHDLGDLIAVIDGRDGLIDECRGSEPELGTYLRDSMRRLLATPAFREALPGHLPGDSASQERLPDLEQKLRELAGLG